MGFRTSVNSARIVRMYTQSAEAPGVNRAVIRRFSMALTWLALIVQFDDPSIIDASRRLRLQRQKSARDGWFSLVNRYRPQLIPSGRLGIVGTRIEETGTIWYTYRGDRG